MKFNIVIISLLCVLLAGCAGVKNQAAQPIASIPVETTAEATAAGECIQPLTDTTMETLEDSIVHISFGQDDFYKDVSGTVFLRMQIYSYEKFDMVDISGLKAGDTILLSGEEIPVNAVERDDHGMVLVNGGQDEGGIDLATDDSGIYFVHGYSDMKSWNLVGETEYPVSDKFVFTDNADLDKREVTYSAENLQESIPAPEYGYQPQNTTVRIENGQVVAMERIYTP